MPLDDPSKWDSAEEIGQRLRAARKARRMVQADLAKVVGRTRAAISQWELGEVQVDMDTLERAARSLQVNLNWLVTGKGDPPKGVNLEEPGEAKVGRPRKEVAIFETAHYTAPQPLAPLYDGVIEELRVGIGAGDAFHDGTDVMDWWRIPPHVFADLHCNPLSCKIYRVLSDTMKPAINRGAYVLIDFSQTVPHDGQIFAIDNGFSVIMKRLFLLPYKKHKNHDISLVSDSDPDNRITVPLKDVTIIGRLIAQLSPIT